MTSSWRLPAQTHRDDKTLRHVGVEIELQGIDIEDIAGLVATTLGGQVTRVSSAEFNVDVQEHGCYRVEVDFSLLKELARDREERKADDRDALMDLAVDLLSGASAVIVPCEIVSPPIAMDRLAQPMDELVAALRDAGAKGTRESVFYAFGVHLNVEPPDLEADTIVRYLRAFVCLYDWIVAAEQVDLSRQLSPYIQPFPKDYDLLLADVAYTPDWPTLIDDYLEHNPTRDRALDMLPMFADVDEDRVRAVVDDPLVKPRPAFHFRLANSCVDDPEWSIANPWNRWARIEELAADKETLDAIAGEFSDDRRRVLRGVDKRWASRVARWLAED